MELIFVSIWPWRGLLYSTCTQRIFWCLFLVLFMTRWVILGAFIPMQEACDALSLFGDACVCYFSNYEHEIEVILIDGVLAIGTRRSR